MASYVKREIANPDIGIGELMKELQTFVVSSNNFDLMELVAYPGHGAFSWKTSPHAGWMMQMHRLVAKFLQVAPNGVLPSAKLKLAILRLCDYMKVNHTKSCHADFADKVDVRIRIVLAQYRKIKGSPYEYQRLMKKATPVEKKQLTVPCCS